MTCSPGYGMLSNQLEALNSNQVNPMMGDEPMTIYNHACRDLRFTTFYQFTHVVHAEVHSVTLMYALIYSQH